MLVCVCVIRQTVRLAKQFSQTPPRKIIVSIPTLSTANSPSSPPVLFRHASIFRATQTCLQRKPFTFCHVRTDRFTPDVPIKTPGASTSSSRCSTLRRTASYFVHTIERSFVCASPHHPQNTHLLSEIFPYNKQCSPCAFTRWHRWFDTLRSTSPFY